VLINSHNTQITISHDNSDIVSRLGRRLEDKLMVNLYNKLNASHLDHDDFMLSTPATPLNLALDKIYAIQSEEFSEPLTESLDDLRYGPLDMYRAWAYTREGW
jgi:hypothetical protein